MASLEQRLTLLAAAIRDKINLMMPRLIPSGGSINQVLTKTGAGDYAAGWQNAPSGSSDPLDLRITDPTAPPDDTVRLFRRKIASRQMPAFVGPSALDSALQPFLARNKVALWSPAGNGTIVSAIGAASLSAVGTATGVNVATTNRHTWQKRIEYLVTVAATNAVAGFRYVAAQWARGAAAGDGGFCMVCRWGPATGVAIATHRGFVGFRPVATPTDVNPSTLGNIIGMGWDSGDANMSIMHNDATGTATKIDLGANFPRPSADRTKAYEIALFCPPNANWVGYLVADLATGAIAEGIITTDLPPAATLLTVAGWMSVGGTSSVIGVALMSLYVETDF
jgi:hypothetical protein